MPTAKPHIAIYTERNPDGSSWSAWRCEGQGVCAFGYSPGEAFGYWQQSLHAVALLAAVAAAQAAPIEEMRTLH